MELGSLRRWPARQLSELPWQPALANALPHRGCALPSDSLEPCRPAQVFGDVASSVATPYGVENLGLMVMLQFHVKLASAICRHQGCPENGHVGKRAPP